MGINISLSVLGVVFGYLFLYNKKPVFKILFLVLWLLFLPNTIYLVTDLQHFSNQYVQLDFNKQLILIAQYVVILFLGIFTFILGFYPLEKTLFTIKFRSKDLVLILANYLMAFGVALGRIERNNSWDIFIDPGKVISSSTNLLLSTDSQIYILLFGSFSSLLYFSLRRFLKNKVRILR